MRIAIVGAAGTVGRASARSLTAAGHSVRLIGRREAVLKSILAASPLVETHAADAEVAASLRAALADCEGVLFSLGLPYTKKDFAKYPAMMTTAAEAAAAAGVTKFIHISNVYPYGPPKTRKVAETHPLTPSTVKGRYRKEQEDALWAVAARTKLRAIVLRPPDYYGPFAELSMAHLMFKAVVDGKTADLLGPVNLPHEFIFTPDLGEVVAALFPRDDVWGESYNVGGTGLITIKDFADKVFAAAGAKPKYRIAAPWLVKTIGLFSSLMGELGEMSYLLTDPLVLDDAKLAAILPNRRRTSYDEGIKQTLAQMKAKPST